MTCYVRGMTNMRWAALATLVLAAGCGSKSNDTPAAADTSSCAGAIDAAASSLMDGRKKNIDDRLGSAADPQKEARMIERSQKVMEQLKAPLNERCTADKWPAEVLTCITTVKKQDELRACLSKLPKDQFDRATADIMKTMQASLKMRPGSMGGVAPNMMGGQAHGIPLMGGQPVTPPPAAGDPTAGAPAPAPAPVAPTPAPTTPAPAAK